MTTPLITLEELRAYPLPVKSAQWDNIGDSQIETVIEYASQNIMDYVDLGIASAYYTQRQPGNNLATLMLDQYPVNSVESITSYNNTEVGTTYNVSDFLIDSGAGFIIWKDRLRNVFWKQYDWTVEYNAGWLTIPGPIKHATALQTIQMLQPLFRGGANFDQVKLIDGVNEEIVDLLERYKRKRIG